MFKVLWKNREQPAAFSRRWLVVWAKRAIHLPKLIKIYTDRVRLTRRGASIGNYSIIPLNSVIGNARNLTVGDNTFVSLGAHLATHGPITIGSNVSINAGAKILTASHSLKDQEWRQFERPINIEDYAWIATDAIILPGVNIGRGAVIGAGAVVRSDVPQYSIAIGNPATISKSKRTQILTYNPTAFVASYEAWLGRNFNAKCSAFISTDPAGQ